jgi:hypothetical protein
METLPKHFLPVKRSSLLIFVQQEVSLALPAKEEFCTNRDRERAWAATSTVEKEAE